MKEYILEQGADAKLPNSPFVPKRKHVKKNVETPVVIVPMGPTGPRGFDFSGVSGVSGAYGPIANVVSCATGPTCPTPSADQTESSKDALLETFGQKAVSARTEYRKKTKELFYDKYPVLFEPYSISEYGSISCGSGWFGIIDELCSDFMELINKSPLPMEEKSFKIGTIK